ncbi:MAG: phosphotransferase, partial [Planctomycetota bacterium]|nr:phosphotransferase [Planctomycetota bacterium]
MDKAQRYGQGPFLEHLSRTLELTAPPHLIRHNTNLIYDCGDQILRLTPNAFRSADEVKRELHWMAFVGQHTDQVVRVLGSDATITQQIEFERESFTATRLQKIEGSPVDSDRWNPRHFERVGRLTGQLHRLGQEYDPPRELALLPWDRSPEACLAHDLPDDGRGLPDLNQKVFEYMAALPQSARHFGPIHYDIHPGNYLLTPDDRLVLFDFENSCLGHYINDIAVVLYYARLNRHSKIDANFDRTFLQAFWK